MTSKIKMTKEQKAFCKRVGSAGGKKSSANMTPEQRHARAVKANRARWQKKGKLRP